MDEWRSSLESTRLWMSNLDDQVWESEDWEESNLDEWNIKFDNQKIIKTKFEWLGDQV